MVRTISILAAALIGASAAQAAVIEDFETGAFGSDWVGTGGASSTAKLEGTYGGTTNNNWYYREDADAQIGDDTVLSLWFRAAPSGAGVRLGFGADASGASSLFNSGLTSALRFENNSGYAASGSTVATAPGGVTYNISNFTPGQWYHLIVSFTATTVTGELRSNNDALLWTTLTVDRSLLDTSGGVALRTGTVARVDTIALANPLPVSSVPEPESWALMALGLGALGAAARRRRAT